MARARKPLAPQRTASSRSGGAVSAMIAKDLPQSVEAEISVLGSMILNNETIDIVVPILVVEDFASAAHQKIFEAIRALHDGQHAVDYVTLRDELERRGDVTSIGGVEYVTTLTDSVPAAVNVEHYARIVREKAIKRNLLGAAREIFDSAADGRTTSRELLDQAQSKIFHIAESGMKGAVAPIKDVLRSAFAQIDRGREGALTGIATGYDDLDELLSGLQNGELIILAARPSMGKTSLALNIIEHVGVHLNLPVAIFSLEMSGEQLATNMLCSHARLDSHRVRRGRLHANERESLPHHVGALSEAPIFIDDSASLNCFELRAKVRQLKARHDLKLIAIDYLQLLEGPAVENRAQQISSISRSLKGLAREMSIPVIALAQLNRQVETRDDHRPRMADLRESGSLEQDADVILLLHRPGYYTQTGGSNEDGEGVEEDGRAEVIIAKQRNGPTGAVPLTFLRQYMRFESSARGEGEFG